MHTGAVVFAVLAAMSIQGSANLQTQLNIVGEFSNLPQEELIEWIKYSTKPGKKKSYYLAVVFPMVLYTSAQSSTQLLPVVLIFLRNPVSRLSRKREMLILLMKFAKEML